MKNGTKKAFSLLLVLTSLLASLSLASCGSGDQDPISADAAAAGEAADDYVFDLTEDDSKIIMTAGNTKQIYYHDGTNITKYEVYIDYESAETAAELIKAYEVAGMLEENKDVYKLTRKGRYLVFDYLNPDDFPMKTYEEAKQYTDLMKQLAQ